MAKKPTLTATLPDGTKATRTTDHKYKFVVAVHYPEEEVQKVVAEYEALKALVTEEQLAAHAEAIRLTHDEVGLCQPHTFAEFCAWQKSAPIAAAYKLLDPDAPVTTLGHAKYKAVAWQNACNKWYAESWSSRADLAQKEAAKLAGYASNAGKVFRIVPVDE